MSKKYLIDSNALIQPNNIYYKLHVIPSFWDWLLRQFGINLFMLDVVKKELCNNKECPLDNWVSVNCTNILKAKNDDKVFCEWKNIIEFLDKSPRYQRPGYLKWMDTNVADPWLIAYAKVYGYTIITFEQFNQDISDKKPTSKEPKIPNICEEFGVEYVDLHDYMLEVNCVI